MKDVISRMKKEVLKGCVLAFSGLIPLHETPASSMVWRMAEDFGAKCEHTLTPSVTHLVATSPRTAKAEQTYRRQNVSVVWPSWLNDSICRWVRQGETAYLIPPDSQVALYAEQADSEATDDVESREAADLHLANMDWGEAEDEVDAYLDERGNEDPAEESSKESDQEGRHTPPTQPGAEQDDMLLSPLSKRRKIVALRGGKSKLRQSIHADDEEQYSSEEMTQGGTKRRRVDESVSVSQADKRKHDVRETGSPAPSEDLLDDLATEMERELDDTLWTS